MHTLPFTERNTKWNVPECPILVLSLVAGIQSKKNVDTPRVTKRSSTLQIHRFMIVRIVMAVLKSKISVWHR